MSLEPSVPRTRRAMLGAALGGVAAVIASAIGRPGQAQAAAGDALRIGQTNSGGTSQTVLLSSAGGASFTLKDTAAGGTGMFGWASAATGEGRGLYGRADSAAGYGVMGRNTQPLGVGVIAEGGTGFGGVGLLATGGNGVVAVTGGNQLAAIFGENTALTGTTYGLSGWVNTSADVSYGIFGHAEGGRGIYGESQTLVGVEGMAWETGSGVYGESVGGVGVEGYTNGDSVGVLGASLAGVGVSGESVDNYGVYGKSTTSDAGYFSGSLFATSSNASIKAFRIDHPLDPANKVLSHSCVESNERKLVYDGVVTTDATGEAIVELPAYFGALNRDVRYQLTVIGSFAQAIVRKEVAAGRFTIATSEPRTKVSWQLTGVRHDAFAKAHPLQVEATKVGKEKGRFINAAEHGQPESKAVDYELRRQLGSRRAATTLATPRARPMGRPAAGA